MFFSFFSCVICLTVTMMAGCSAEIILTQSPSVDSVSVGSSVTLNCRSSSSSFTQSLAWYHQRPGQTPKLLFSSVGSKVSGVSERFTDGRSGTNFMLNIRNVQSEDAGDYYCQQYYERPLTQWDRAVQKPLQWKRNYWFRHTLHTYYTVTGPCFKNSEQFISHSKILVFFSLIVMI